jgi:hypothetical protein
MFELAELEDLPDHSPISDDLDMLEQHTIVDCGSSE